MAEAGLPRILTIMGSGETTPTMVRAHRAVFERLGREPVAAVLLDTPYGFQENAADISNRAVEYFRDSVGHPITVASLLSADVDPLVRESAIGRIRAASLVFTGPGSPSYALRQWSPTEVPLLIADKLMRGGAVTMASAAALTLGRFTIPVYEIYKVGEDPRWLPGLDLLSPLGLPVAVIPHYDNAEGGNHDTRFCYLGERRLRVLEAMLPPEAFVLGVDGHTALTLDLASGEGEVLGLGGVTVRKDGRSVVFPAGSKVTIKELVLAAVEGTSASRMANDRSAGDASSADGTPIPAAQEVARSDSRPAGPARTLREDVDRLDAVFNEALARGDAPAAVRAILVLEEAIQAWASDTEQSDDLAVARSTLRSEIVCLGELAVAGTRDPRETVGPFVDALLAERLRARTARDWTAADAIRDRLLAAGIEIHDMPDGTTWELRPAEPVG